jgi:predicted O-methyltransferase YrrM
MNKPVYTGDFCAFSAADAEALTELVQRVAKPSCRIAEVGSWLGDGSTQVILDAIRDVTGARLTCIDTWQGSPGVTRHASIAAHYDVLATFKRNTALDTEIIKTVTSDSAKAARLFSDGHFDLVFIDADHRYDAVRADIAAWRRKVRPGGILCGHDCEARPTPELLPALISGKGDDVVRVPGHRFAAIHAGCVLAVHEAFNGSAHLHSEDSASSVWSWNAPASLPGRGFIGRLFSRFA